MKATIPFLENKFDEFNVRCFGGELPTVPIVLSSSRTFLGKLVYQKVRGPFGIVCGTTNFEIRISNLFDLPQDELEDVLIHEMIHYHIAYHRLHDKSAHGSVFRSMMDDINRRFGRNITVSHRSLPGSGCPLRHNDKPVYVCISELGDKDLGVTVCSVEMYERISRGLKRCYPSLSCTTWHLGYNLFIDRYPRCRTPKIFRLKRSDLDACLKGLKRV